MKIEERQQKILQALVNDKTLSRHQLQGLTKIPESQMKRLLHELQSEKFINLIHLSGENIGKGNYVFYQITNEGKKFLANPEKYIAERKAEKLLANNNIVPAIEILSETQNIENKKSSTAEKRKIQGNNQDQLTKKSKATEIQPSKVILHKNSFFDFAYNLLKKTQEQKLPDPIYAAKLEKIFQYDESKRWQGKNETEIINELNREFDIEDCTRDSEKYFNRKS